MTTFDTSTDLESQWSQDSNVRNENSEIDEFYDEERSGFAGFFDAHQAALLLLLAVILLSPLLVYGGMQIDKSHPPQVLQALVSTSGVQMMTAEELTASVAAEKRTVYWMGPITGDKYVDNSAKNGIDQISYLSANVTHLDTSEFDLRVTTYGNQHLYDAQPHSPASKAEKTATNSFGTQVKYDPTNPNQAIVRFASKPQIIVIDYPTAQSEASIVDNAQILVRLAG